MSFSRLSEEDVKEIQQAAADPAYRELNRVEGELSERFLGKTPDERFHQLIEWLRVLLALGVRLEPDRSLPVSRVSRL